MTRTGRWVHGVAAAGLLLCISAGAAHAATDISDCRTLSSANSTYRLVADLTSTGTCLDVRADDVTIDGNGHTITYTSDSNDQAAIYTRYANSPVIHDVTINMTNGVGDNGPAAIRSKGSVTIYNCTINVVQNANGTVWGISSQGSGERSIHHNTLRGSGDGSVVLIQASGVSDTSKVSGAIHDNDSTLDGDLHQSPGSRPAHVSIGRSFPDPGEERLQIYSNTMTNASSSLRESQGVTLFEVNNTDIFDNVYNDSGGHSRSITLDYANNCTVHGNRLNLGNSGGGANQGIRMRYGSHDNEIYENTITAVGQDVFCIAVGAEGAQPYDSVIHHNVLSATDHAIRVTENIRDIDFHNNTITINDGSGSGAAVYLLEYHTTSGSSNHIENISFNHESITNNTSSQVIRFQDLGDDGPTGVSLCGMTVDGSDLDSGDIHNAGGSAEWTVASPPCAYDSSGGTNTDPPVDPPAAPANLRRTDKRS